MISPLTEAPIRHSLTRFAIPLGLQHRSRHLSWISFCSSERRRRATLRQPCLNRPHCMGRMWAACHVFNRALLPDELTSFDNRWFISSFTSPPPDVSLLRYEIYIYGHPVLFDSLAWLERVRLELEGFKASVIWADRNLKSTYTIRHGAK